MLGASRHKDPHHWSWQLAVAPSIRFCGENRNEPLVMVHAGVLGTSLELVVGGRSQKLYCDGE
jgi:hypothetical protein